jgi:HemY protein
MRRAFLFLIIGIVVIAAAWGLANLPGQVTASIGSLTIETSVAFAILALLALFVVGLILLRVLGGILGLPKTGAAWRHRRRLNVGERAITRVLVALAAGDQREARTEARKAQQLLGASPQTLLLVAEAGRLSGREEEAEQAFRALTQRSDSRFLGFRGLLRQAIDRQDWVEAQRIAREAEAAHPGTVWLRQQRAELAIQAENWAEAAELALPDRPRATYFVAAADAETDPRRSLQLAKQAWKEDPGFTPAVLCYASKMRSTGHENRAQASVSDAWQRAPHPDLADFALARSADPLARYQSAKRLVARNPDHPESRLLLSKAAMDADLPGEARHQAEAARDEGVNQRRLWLIIAEIEEHEHGDDEEGRKAQREAFRRAAAADPDPKWQCANCHADFERWSAKCPSCGAVGTLGWHTGSPIISLPIVA